MASYNGMWQRRSTTIRLMLNVEPLQKTGQRFLGKLKTEPLIIENPTTDAYVKEIKSVCQGNICILPFTLEYSQWPKKESLQVSTDG